MIPQRTPSPGPTHRIPLPPGHFLSLQPSYSQSTDLYPSGAPSTAAHDSNGLAPNVASLASADFDVDVRSGFLPSSRNVERLPVQWEVWEEALDAARGTGVGDGLRLGGGRDKDRWWRSGIDGMPVLDSRPLERSVGLMRRAHVVLTFLLHFYVHTSPSSSASHGGGGGGGRPIRVPQSIARPLSEISRLLGVPPVVTYADTVLWNVLPLQPDLAPHHSANPPTSALTTFTNTRSEENFYIISAQCEIAGASALKLMRQSLDELFLADSVAVQRLTTYLRKLAVQIDKVGDITLSMIKHIDPEDFYHLIRPWFRGSDNGPDSQPWDMSDPVGSSSSASPTGGQAVEQRLYSGPSAGQSSLIHAIDIFLTVDHTERSNAVESNEPTSSATRTTVAQHGTENGGASTTNSDDSVHIMTDHTPISTERPTQPAPTEANFVQRMLEYMPLPHRTFLLHLSTHPTPLRQLVIQHAQTSPDLVAAYDGALEALKRFREKHMRVVSIFIVQQARRQPSLRIRQLLGQDNEEVMGDDGEETAASGASTPGVELGEMRGTGGSLLFKFLKRCRDNTTRAMIGGNKGPDYELR